MDSEASRTMKVAALGRPFSLGMLYDCRKDSLFSGLTLWDRSDLAEHIGERPQNYNDFEIVASESIEDKSSALNVKASLKASFLGGLVEVAGSAKYLNDSKTSKNQARITLKYKATTKVKELSMDHLGRGNVKHPYVFDKGLATHVVTAVLYGAQAFFVFDREVSEKENHREIEGNLKVMIKKIPRLVIEGEGSLEMEDKDREKVEKFSCRFFGDFSLQKMPTSFQDAIQVCQSLPTLLGANGENAVPMKVWLLPLTCLDSSAAKLVRQISETLVNKSQSVLEYFSELEMRCNDALKTTTAQQFPQIGTKIKTFKEMCSEFKLEFQQTLAKKLPSIRGGGEEEAVLAEILKKRHSSPFNSKDLNKWMDCKEREIHTLKSFTNMMKNTEIVSSETDLYKEILSADHAVCFVFTSLGSDEPYLSTLSEYLEETTKPDEARGSCTHDVEKEQWYASREVADKMRSKAKLFSDFAEANKENKNIKFLVVGLTDDTQKGSSIYLYKDGFSVNKNFEPPSKPETLTVRDINHNSVTLKISPAKFGAEHITSYSVEYCVSGQDGWKEKTAAEAEEVTVSDLSPNTEYKFRCRAVTSVGVGPANELGGSIQTLPCSPPGKPQVEPNSREISVSWDKPAELGQDVQILNYIVEYAKTDSRVKEEDLQWNQKMSDTEKTIISGLQPETEYVVRVRCDCGEAGRSKESISVGVCTKKYSLAESLRSTGTCVNSKSPSVYKLHLTEENMDVCGFQRYRFGNDIMGKNRTVIIFGEPESGQSRLINGMINYIVGVEWEDNFRFQLLDEDQMRSQANSQTSEVNVYKINHQQGFKIDYSLTIVTVDSPGFGDKRGIKRDKEITEQLFNLFSSNNGVSEVDAVCFVAQVSVARLTPAQIDVFDSVLSIFGKDVAENTRVLVTFADGHLPPVLEAITASGVPCPETEDGLPVHVKFNNSALFADNKSSAAGSMMEEDEDEDGNFEQMCWNMGIRSMKRFFDALNVIETKSLTLTKEVLRERQQLENSVGNLHKWVTLGLAKLEEIEQTNEKLKEHQTVMNRTEKVLITHNVIDGDRGYDSAYRCPEWKKASQDRAHAEEFLVKLKSEYDHVQAEVMKLMESSAKCLNRLKEIALKPNPLSTPDYVDLLIEGEKSECKPGWKQRVEHLTAVREQAEYMAKVERGETLLQSPSTDLFSYNQANNNTNPNKTNTK
uniref:Fibronectin type-III domain-containing protein n=1 Tax=Sparus aurata TaxID=8175 RepID=A0A671US05_SPAAU